FSYDANGTPVGFNLIAPSGAAMPYYYGTNSRGDVVAIYNYAGTLVATYSYDAYGKPTDTTIFNTGHTFAVNQNPLRYRGYVYDKETGLYYLQSRYYDPETCRFINADGYVSTGQDITGYNMFVYCGNNPVNRKDSTGMFWKEIGDFFSNAWNGIKTWGKNTFGAGSSTTATIAEIETPVIPDPSPITVKTGIKTTQTISKHGDSSKFISVYANKDAQHPIKSSSAGININIVNFTLDLSVGLDDVGLSGSLTNGNTTNSFGVKLNLSELRIGFEGSTAIQWDNTTETAYTNASISGWAIAAAYLLVTTGQYVQLPSYAN
ncbi:MAG: RHS repeat-associated core domain-containing protein, partial [Ruminococcus sp.]|nr:RHS repeat-associated core domain-containing protein [Ruminococcus sp.]